MAYAGGMRTYLPPVAQPARDEARGLTLVVVSTSAYALLPILGKLAYAEGLRPLPLLAWRYAIATALIALLDRGTRLPLRTRLRLWAVGAVFVLNSVAYFRALETVPASVVSLVLYVYPVVVALLAAVAGLEPLRARGLLAAAAAFVYAGYIVLSSRFGSDAPARALALHLAQVAALACAALALAGPGLALPRSLRAWAVVAAIGVVPTVVAMTTFLAGMAIVGPTRASVLSSLEVIVTLALAFALLGERLTPWQWTGAALILGAVAWQNLGALRAVAARRGA